MPTPTVFARTRLGAGLIALGLAATPASASVFGSLGNFDVVNDTGKIAHGFEIDLEGLHSSDITDTFGGAGRGFPTTVERYGAPTIAEYITGATFGVRIVYQTSPVGGAWTIGTPSGAYTTPGESCWTGGRAGYGPSTPCDHFGVGTRGSATKTTYSWLVESSPGSTSLVNAASYVPAPTWTVTPAAPAPGVPAAPPVVVAHIQAPPPPENPVEPQFGTPIWVKVFTTEFDAPVALEDLLGGEPVIQAALGHTEMEWQLLQTDPGNPLAGAIDNGGAAAAGPNAESVVRRYEFYKYTGAVNAVDNQAQPSLGDSMAAPGEVGAFIGAQNAALNLVAANNVANVPAPASIAVLGVALLGLAAARRRVA